jgi:hypothetical protein
VEVEGGGENKVVGVKGRRWWQWARGGETAREVAIGLEVRGERMGGGGQDSRQLLGSKYSAPLAAYLAV